MVKEFLDLSINKINEYFKYIDNHTSKILLCMVSMLVLIGIYMSFSATFAITTTYFIKHLFFVIGGLFIFALFGCKINYKIYQKYRFIIFLALIVILIITFFIGHSAKGATRWIPLPFGFRFQPSELAKIILIFITANFISKNKHIITQTNIWVSFICVSIICGLIYFQNDLGTVILIFSTWIIMLFVSGISLKKLSTISIPILCFFVYAIIKAPHRITRVIDCFNSFFNLSSAHPNVRAAFAAFGSGGFFGKGPGNSDMKLKFLPEFHTDFIFPILGEEWGFIGATLTILIFVSIFICGLRISKNCEDEFGKNLALGITLTFSLQFMINMGMTTGLIPTKGMTLPFISYGGTSMITSMIMMGILLNVSKVGKKR